MNSARISKAWHNRVKIQKSTGRSIPGKVPSLVAVKANSKRSFVTEIELSRSKRLFAHAKSLANSQQFEEALNAYMSILQNETWIDGFPIVFPELLELTKHFPPTKLKLIELRDERERAIRSGKVTFDLFHEWLFLTLSTDEERVTQLYDELKVDLRKNEKAVGFLRDALAAKLVSAGRYAEFTNEELLKQAASLVEFADRFSKNGAMKKALADPQIRKSTTKRVVNLGSALFQCALAKGDKVLAEKLCDLVLEREKSAESFGLLFRAAVGAGVVERARELASQAKSCLKGKELVSFIEVEQQIHL